MPETSLRNYQSMDRMIQEVAADPWTKFCVFEAGNTHGAHSDIVERLINIGHTEVESAECDYLLVICPVVSRVKADINAAMDSMPADKPAILVVMHHTFNTKQVVAESRRQVNNPNILLTVDCLFHGQNLLECDRNDAAWFEIRKFLQVSGVQVPEKNWIISWTENHWRSIAVSIAISVLLVIVLVIIFVQEKKT